MAATATQQIINNGSRNLVLKYTIAGTSGDTNKGTLVDISALSAANAVTGGLKLNKAKWSLTGFSCLLEWDGAPDDTDLLQLSVGDGDLNFEKFGGITNNAEDQTGDVLFTTTGYGASGEGGHVLLSFKKKGGSTFDPNLKAGDPAALIFTGFVPVPMVS